MIDLSHLTIQIRPIGEIIPFAGNARTHSAEQVAQVVKSIEEFGWTNPILVGADNVIIAGHARLEAARTLKMTDVPVIVLPHLSEAQRRALVVADNQLALGAGWDDGILREQLQLLQEDDFDLNLLGFSDEELVSLMNDPERLDEGNNDADATPEPPKNPVSRPGDMWLLGPHRLLVGDATSSADVARLIGSDHADLVFTDPPYGVDYQGYTKDRLKIQGDKMTPERFKQFLTDVFASYRTLIKDGASMYVCHSSSWQREFQTALEAAGFEVRCQIIWAKNTFAWGFGRYKFQHEPLFYVHVAGESDAWYGDKSQSTLWQEKKPAANRLHPTMKPVALVVRALRNSSKAGDLVVDLFGGSGTTMIACQRLGRNARLMEIDPLYADVIVQRWQQHVGQMATLEATGECFDAIEPHEVAA